MRRPETIRAIADPTERALAAQAAVIESRALTSEYATITREAVREMRANGMSLAKVARSIGVTRTRVQQLEK
jgi:DNA-binding transcriptional regulator YiaG